MGCHLWGCTESDTTEVTYSNSFVVGFPTVVKPEAGHRLVIRWDLTQDAKPGIAFSRAGA